jgi:hypothetical protein
MGPTEYYDIAAQTIPEPSTCFTVVTRHSGVYASLGVLQMQTLPDVGNGVKDDSSDHVTRVSSFLISRFYGCDVYATEHYFQ